MNTTPRATRTRRYARPLSVAASVVVAVLPALPAHAAAPRVSLAEAIQSLPAAAELPPGNVTESTRRAVPRPTGLDPCNIADAARVNLGDNGAAIGVYSTPANAPVAQLSQWVVATRIFASAAVAHEAIARLGAGLRDCPRTAQAQGMSFTRTTSAHYVTVAGWHGYHTVDSITLNAGSTRLRHIAVYLQRGNALIQVDEIATAVGPSPAVQETRRLAVQRMVAARVTAAARS